MGLIALKSVLNNDKYINFITLHVVFSILLNPTSYHNVDLRAYATSLVRIFVHNFVIINGDCFIIRNFQRVIRLTYDVD